MNKNSRNQIVSILILSLMILSCQYNQNKTKVGESIESSPTDSNSREDNDEIKAVLNRILIAVGNRDVKELSALSFDQAIIGYTYSKDGVWLNKKLTIEDYLSNISKIENPKPFSETSIEYDISVTNGRLATVILPTVISEFGVTQTEEVNHVIMMKENEQWKLLSIAWTAHKIPESEREFNLNLFAEGYAQVWGSNRPEFVAMFFEEDGILQINNGEPAVGRNAITNVVKGFMDAFPDMIVALDSLETKSDKTLFHWTLTGTNNGINGTGNKVKISGFEEWSLNDKGLIQKSIGSFDEKEYQRQLEFGIN
jgi:hypothetical protein